jgi:hypothetical protein
LGKVNNEYLSCVVNKVKPLGSIGTNLILKNIKYNTYSLSSSLFEKKNIKNISNFSNKKYSEYIFT